MHGAAVGHGATDQEHITPDGVDPSEVCHSRRAAPFENLITAREELAVLEIQRRQHEAMYVDAAPGTDKDAVRVDEEDITVRPQRPMDLAEVTTRHPVEHRGIRPRLDEPRHLIRIDGEALPIDDRIGGALPDVQDSSSLALHRHVSVDDDSTAGIRLERHVPPGEGREQGEQNGCPDGTCSQKGTSACAGTT
jgi:hypothetical protein